MNGTVKGTMSGMRARLRCARWAGNTLLVIVLALGLGCPSLTRGLEGAEEPTPAYVPPIQAAPDQDPQALLVVGHQVFQNLVTSPAAADAAAKVGGSLEWRFFLLNDQSVNAHSDAKGRVWVGGGLAQKLGQDRGLWAAVLAHEIAHGLLRHPSRGLTVLHQAFPYVFGKVLRDREHRADAAGMMLMARAGYHPDSLLALHHLLEAAHGERPGAVAFFGSHPRWQTREQRLESVQPQAVAAFQQAWPDAAASPGGAAPLVVFLDAPKLVPGSTGMIRIRVPLACRNATGPVTVVVSFLGAGSIPAKVSRSLACPDKKGSVVEVELAAGGVGSQVSAEKRGANLGHQRKARVEVLGSDGALRARSRPFSVRVRLAGG